MRAGPCAPIVEKGKQQDPIAISQGMSPPAGLAKDARSVCEVGVPGGIFFLGTGLVLALTFRTSLAWNSGVQLW